jgi:hypothetical protein
LITGHGMAPALGGVGVGLVASFALTRWLASLLFGISLLFSGAARDEDGSDGRVALPISLN